MRHSITVNVTQDCINRGKPNNRKRCPIALAIKKAIRGSKPLVAHTTFHFDNPEIDSPQYRLPGQAQDFINFFDAGFTAVDCDYVKPFSFTFQLEEQ